MAACRSGDARYAARDEGMRLMPEGNASRETALSGESTRNADVRVSQWQVAFVQDCNLRCTYCGTGFGATGRPRGHMSEQMWRRLCAFALEHAPEKQLIEFEFGVGETFLHYDAFLRAVDHLQGSACDAGVSLRLIVTTNGTLLDRARMEQLASREISLVFSIDGPKALHDRCRKDRRGKGSFDRAIESWRCYRELCARTPEGPRCRIQSVVSEKARLADVIPFWLEQGQTIFDAVAQNPSPFVDPAGNLGLRERRERFLADLESWAMNQAGRLRVPDFLSDYSGPSTIIEAWERIFLEREAPTCGAGVDTFAVDIHGSLYPCEGFEFAPQWCVGDLEAGIDGERLARFQTERREAERCCLSCDVKGACARSCFAIDSEKGLAESFGSGCWYAKRRAEIALRSYTLLSEPKEASCAH